MDIKVSSITLLDREESKTRAIATLVVNDEFAIHGLKVIDGKNGEFVQMPQKRDIYGKYNDIIFPVTAELREQINNAVLERYKNPISIEDLQLRKVRKVVTKLLLSHLTFVRNHTIIAKYDFVRKGVKHCGE